MTQTEAAYWQIETDPAAHRFPVRPLDNWVAVGCCHESAIQMRHRANLAPERRQALVDGNPVRVGRRKAVLYLAVSGLPSSARSDMPKDEERHHREA